MKPEQPGSYHKKRPSGVDETIRVIVDMAFAWPDNLVQAFLPDIQKDLRDRF